MQPATCHPPPVERCCRRIQHKVGRIGNKFITSIFCSETFYKHKRNELFIQSGMTSYEQLLHASLTAIAQHQELRKSISQWGMPRILSNGNWKICSVHVEISVSRSRIIVIK